MANTSHLKSPAGLLQIVHLLFGIVAVGCGAASFESQFFRERFFFWSVVTFLIVSVLLLIASTASGNVGVRAISSGCHAFGGIVLLAAGSLMVLSVKYISDELCEPNPWEVDCNFDKPIKIAAAAFTIINGILYLAAAALVMMVKKDEDSDAYAPPKKTFARPSSASS